MADETLQEAIERVELMASGDPQWDLSENDREALKLVLSCAPQRTSENLTARCRVFVEKYLYFARNQEELVDRLLVLVLSTDPKKAESSREAAAPPHCPNCETPLPDLDYRREGTVASWAAPSQSVEKRLAAQQEPGLRQGNPK